MSLTAAQSRDLAAFLAWQGRTALTTTVTPRSHGRVGVVVTLTLDGPLMEGDISRALGKGAQWLGCWMPQRGPDYRERCGVKLSRTLELEIVIPDPVR